MSEVLNSTWQRNITIVDGVTGVTAYYECHCTHHYAVHFPGSNSRNHALHASGSYQRHVTVLEAKAKTQTVKHSTEMHHTHT